MKKMTIAVLMGGISAEREVSLNSGREVVKALKKLGKYQVKIYDPKTDLLKLMQDKDKIDVALPVLHGPSGEDGTIQGFLELCQIPYGFSGVLASALGIDKLLQRMIFEKVGISMPKYVVCTKNSNLGFNHYPCVVKPNAQGSSVGVSICKDKKELKRGLKETFKYDSAVLVEEYIKGRELTVGVMGSGKNATAFPVTEIIPKQKFFNYQAKYDGTTDEIVPAKIPREIAKEAQRLALLAHGILRCSGVTRTDMILGSSRKAVSSKQFYVLEINTIPGFTKESLIPKAAKAAGYEFEELVEKLIEIAFEGQNV